MSPKGIKDNNRDKKVISGNDEKYNNNYNYKNNDYTEYNNSTSGTKFFNSKSQNINNDIKYASVRIYFNR